MDELVAASLRLGLPILLAALGELVAEKSGVINVGLEGMMLSAAFAAFTVGWLSGRPALGLAAGVLAALALALVFAVWCVWAGADPIVTGMVLNLMALGVTGFLLRAVLKPRGQALAVPTFSGWPLGVGLAGVAVLYLLLRYTWVGLRLEAVGEAPGAAEARGVSVVRTRTAATLVGGAFAGAAGAFLVLAHAGTFVEGMTAGRGFIALALVLFGRWHPLGVWGATLFFGGALALEFDLQARGLPLPYQFVRALPYVLTLAVLALGASGSRRAPAALGRFYRGR